MEIWELTAREQIRDTLARYNWSGDAGRLDGLAETVCTDGVLEIRGGAELRGQSEILAFLGGVTGRIAGTGGLERIVFNDKLWEQRRESMLTDLHQRVRDVRQGPDGLIYLLTEEDDGAVLRIEPVK